MGVRWFELRYPPVVYLTTGLKQVTRLDQLTLEQAREVILRLADELEAKREECFELERGFKQGYKAR